jgi:hypothetical protein
LKKGRRRWRWKRNVFKKSEKIGEKNKLFVRKWDLTFFDPKTTKLAKNKKVPILQNLFYSANAKARAFEIC